MDSKQLIALLRQINRRVKSELTEKKLLHHRVPSRENVLMSFGNAAAPYLQKKFNLLVWNIHKAKQTGWLDDFIYLASNKDIILLQEAYLRPVMKDFIQATRLFQWDLAQGFVRGKKEISAGVMTGSITPPEEVFFLRSPDREPFVKTPKMAIGTTYRLLNSSRKLLVLNVHGLNFVSLKKFRNHMLQLEVEMAGHRGPIILGGDFNTWMSQRADFLEEMAYNLQLQLINLYPDNRSRHFGCILDHVFIRELDIISAACHPGIKSSDHRPIEMALELREG
ncbi:MAG: endonuclease/exonuclease/phosphatase family protein [Desulfobulbaceae bacterium]|nr:endonuclease/exonuclease/phosphatase family protein [Desulfobulbaceae bacterium]